MTAPTEPGVYAGVPESVYHGDTPRLVNGKHVGSLSSSAGRKLLELAPAEWRYAQDHPQVREVTEAMEFGSAVHTAVLGVGDPIVIVDAGDWKKKADQETRKAIRAEGGIPLLPKQLAKVHAMRDAVRQHEVAGPLFASGTPEVSGYARDPETGVMLRARIDWLRELGGGRRVAIDLKTADSSDPEEFGKECGKFEYHVQQPWYEDVFAERGMPLTHWLWVVVAKRPPHLVSVCELPPRAVDLGRAIKRRAVDTYARCAEADDWPGHLPVIHQIDLPYWAYKQEENQQ
ncbi:PD-(D/E)XK nuclease-like domain-containing protein [Nocardia fluminea]|uniref:PDDEXK-like uncharacterized protein DUF3799 n=1 Tax=Nocardia fluminea TaxID=134984 RepID=A0A2N3VGV8_9NOCA|nr:PD-(D/E)XK nuclease-like domain-containing protein [Nocardia fluminea]PKV80861.1 PDDEXK-like uncharacterized protein DUF3799 [Nocardia fluminea]